MKHRTFYEVEEEEVVVDKFGTKIEKQHICYKNVKLKTAFLLVATTTNQDCGLAMAGRSLIAKRISTADADDDALRWHFLQSKRN